ncbi:unnamed protein product [Brassica oleracea var. botrytis]
MKSLGGNKGEEFNDVGYESVKKITVGAEDVNITYIKIEYVKNGKVEIPYFSTSDNSNSGRDLRVNLVLKNLMHKVAREEINGMMEAITTEWQRYTLPLAEALSKSALIISRTDKQMKDLTMVSRGEDLPLERCVLCVSIFFFSKNVF